MTWGQFKKEVEAKGVTDEMPIDYIDVTGFDGTNLEIKMPEGTFGVAIT